MTSSRMRLGAFVAGGLAVAFALAFVVSPHASDQPDGLNRVAIDAGFDTTEEPHALDDTPTAGYALREVVRLTIKHRGIGEAVKVIAGVARQSGLTVEAIS